MPCRSSTDFGTQKLFFVESKIQTSKKLYQIVYILEKTIGFQKNRARLRINRDFVKNRGTINRARIFRDFEPWFSRAPTVGPEFT